MNFCLRSPRLSGTSLPTVSNRTSSPSLVSITTTSRAPLPSITRKRTRSVTTKLRLSTLVVLIRSNSSSNQHSWIEWTTNTSKIGFWTIRTSKTPNYQNLAAQIATMFRCLPPRLPVPLLVVHQARRIHTKSTAVFKTPLTSQMLTI